MTYITEPDWSIAPADATLFMAEDSDYYACWYRYNMTKDCYQYQRVGGDKGTWVDESTRSNEEIEELSIPRPTTSPSQLGMFNDVENW